MLQFDDGALARILIGATRFERDADRTALLRKFAYLAERRPREVELGHLAHLKTGVSAASRDAVRRRPRRSPAAEKQRRYRERLRRGIAYVPLPVTRLIVDYLARRGLLPRDREAADRVEIGLAAAAALERAARADR